MDLGAVSVRPKPTMGRLRGQAPRAVGLSATALESLQAATRAAQAAAAAALEAANAAQAAARDAQAAADSAKETVALVSREVVAAMANNYGSNNGASPRGSGAGGKVGSTPTHHAEATRNSLNIIKLSPAAVARAPASPPFPPTPGSPRRVSSDIAATMSEKEAAAKSKAALLISAQAATAAANSAAEAAEGAKASAAAAAAATAKAEAAEAAVSGVVSVPGTSTEPSRGDLRTTTTTTTTTTEPARPLSLREQSLAPELVARWEEEMQFTAEQQETMRDFRQAMANTSNLASPNPNPGPNPSPSPSASPDPDSDHRP